MDLLAIIRIAMRALARNKLRSILTMLGIIIGVGAVIAMVSVGQGAQQQAQQQIAAMGSNMLFVQSGTVNRGGMRMGWGATKTLVYDDMLAILRECPSVKAAAPGSQASAQVVFGNDNWATNINGTEPQYFDIRSWPMAEGSSFTQDDVSMAANVAVIGETVRKNLFGATDPIGQTVHLPTELAMRRLFAGLCGSIAQLRRCGFRNPYAQISFARARRIDEWIVVRNPVAPVFADDAGGCMLVQIRNDAQDLADQVVEALRVRSHGNDARFAGRAIAAFQIQHAPVRVAGPGCGIEDQVAHRMAARVELYAKELAGGALKRTI